jgi:hypothetical protein
MPSNGRRASNRKSNGAKPGDLARTAVQVVAELTGQRPEKVLGLKKDGDEWKITVELVELSRVPNSTDLLGCYVVTLGDDGDLVGYERVSRYQRGQAGGDDR